MPSTELILFDVQNPAFDDIGTLPGRVKVSGYGENMIYRGDIVHVQGKLRQMKGGRQGQVVIADIHGATGHDGCRHC